MHLALNINAGDHSIVRHNFAITRQNESDIWADESQKDGPTLYPERFPHQHLEWRHFNSMGGLQAIQAAYDAEA